MPEERPFKVILVDDVAGLRRLLRIVLEARPERFEVVGEAINGQAGIDLARTHQPDLVLLDLSMPVMDGLEALPRILEVSPCAKVVVLSGFTEERMGPVATKRGATAYVEKGATPEKLLAKLEAVMCESPETWE